ncbi:hypothetical protein E3O42_16850 [Cryobacterium adonitolivorans]|uniref:Asl1-like glycosyl hydrolase catalytic domain-containing protein n=1 Tax=Cryobacterium adonitolivorans TaxID=1259189 RepID=A0A4R8VZI4_9MICO|nr:hypothetical protein [Cryobacterium adonitolivorans]TFB96806.1 hypothetical protein E3O42_16850 [Cryobacterium adonitolivorans]
MTNLPPSDRRRPKVPALKRRTWWIGGIAVVLGALLCSLIVVQPWARTNAQPAAPTTANPTPTLASVPALDIATPPSDTFDWWNAEVTSSHVQFLGSDSLHDGTSSLAITSDLVAGSGETARLQQGIGAAVGSTYTIGLWAKSTDAGEGAIKISPSEFGGVPEVLPAGTYDWTYIEFDYTAVTPNVNLRVSADGPTAGTLIDSLSVTGPDGAVMPLMNSGFESSSYDLTVINPTLLFAEGDTNLQVETRRGATGTLNWSVTDSIGTVVDDGTTNFSDSRAIADLRDLPTGMYTAALSAEVGERTVDRSTALAVMNPEPIKATSATSPFAVFLHYLGGEPRLTNMVDTLAIAGIRNARVEMTWPAIEVEKGTYQYTDPIDSTLQRFRDNGISPLMVPVYGNSNYDGGLTPSTDEGLAAYARFSAAVAEHYKDVGGDFEVYNEYDHIFNSGLCGKTPECYMEMLSVTADAVKAANPDAVIAAPGNAGMGLKLDALQDFFDVGGLEYTDVVSAHPYVQPAAPEALVPEIDRLVQMIKDSNGGESKPIWFTEMGWSGVDGWVSEQQQADYLVRTMALSLGHGVSRVYWFEAASLSLDSASIEHNFGLFKAPSSFLPNTNEPRPAAIAQAVMAKQIDGQTFSIVDAAPEGVQSYVFTGGKADTRVMWSVGAAQSVDISTTESVTVTNQLGVATVLKPTAGIVTVELSESPVYVKGVVSAVAAG